MADVCLVSMPYAGVERPSLALGTLAAVLRSQGILTEVRHAGLTFAEQIGLRSYVFLSFSYPRLLMGEWTFARAAFPEFTPDPAAFLDLCARREVPRRMLASAREKAAPFVEHLAREVVSAGPRIVGCTTTFQQHCASLALLRRVKELQPGIATLLGGANCEQEMGRTTHDAFPWVDYVFSGEAEEPLPRVCWALLRGRPEEAAGIRGALAPGDRGKPAAAGRRGVAGQLDLLPVPDYRDYFDELAASSLASSIVPGLPFETSRGCWWGQRRHCTFCGLSDQARRYRTKSASRVAREWRQLRERHGVARLMATDSIYDPKRLAGAFRPQEGEAAPVLFFETPGSLTPSQVEQLAGNGIRWIQPGFESLHDGFLTLLDKGTRAWKNVRMLRACLQHGVFAAWNLLAGVPGEEAAWYREMMEWLPSITHLQPPFAFYPIRFDRFSRYWEEAQHYGLQLLPGESYAHVYPLAPERLRDLAYFFDDGGPGGRERQRLYDDVLWELQSLVVRWESLFHEPEEHLILRRAASSRPRLIVVARGDQLVVTDTRPGGPDGPVELDALASRILGACEQAPLEQALPSAMGEGWTVAPTDISRSLESLVERRLVLRLSGHLIALPTRDPCARFPDPTDNPSGVVLLPRRAKSENAS